MRFLIPIVALLTIAAACGSGDAANETPTPTQRILTRTPEPGPSLLGEVPEGRIIIARTTARRAQYSLSGDSVTGLPDGDLFASPNGAHAALARRSSAGSYDAIGLIEGDEARIIHEWEYGWHTGVIWDYDSSRFAYSVVAEPASADQPVDIWVVDADGGNRGRFATAPEAHAIGWAADGRLLIGGSGFLLALASEDGDVEEIPELPEDEIFDRSLSPDGTRLAVQAGYIEDKGSSQVLHMTSLWVYDIAAGTWTETADLDVNVRRPTAFVSASAALAASAYKGPPPIDWSPDGEHIAYTKTIDDPETGDLTWELWLADVSAGTSERIATDAYQAAWSPDSRYVSFITAPEVAIAGAGYHRLGGGETETIKELRYGSAETTAWTPDGRLIVSFKGAIQIVDPATGTATDVVDENGDGIGGAYIYGAYAHSANGSPSGRYLAFSAWGKVYVLDTATATARTLIEGGGYYPAGWLP